MQKCTRRYYKLGSGSRVEFIREIRTKRKMYILGFLNWFVIIKTVIRSSLIRSCKNMHALFYDFNYEKRKCWWLVSRILIFPLSILNTKWGPVLMSPHTFGRPWAVMSRKSYDDLMSLSRLTSGFFIGKQKFNRPPRHKNTDNLGSCKRLGGNGKIYPS